MRTLRSLLGLLAGLVVMAGVASAVIAAIAKRHLVSRGAEDDDQVDLVVIFDGLEFTSRARAFRSGSILTWYGGATIDLTDARLDPAGAVLEARTVFGGLQLIVPPAWPVDLQVVGFAAGVADTRDPGAIDPSGPRLLLTGWAMAGGVAVIKGGAERSAQEGPVERAAEAGAGG
jgi:hypothetical protein